jgi:hypothetical protein
VAPLNSQRVDATGKCAIPVANGIVGVRDMWSDSDDIVVARRWNDETASGRLIGPRVMVKRAVPINACFETDFPRVEFQFISYAVAAGPQRRSRAQRLPVGANDPGAPPRSAGASMSRRHPVSTRTKLSPDRAGGMCAV